ncbi:DNA-processing protein DprA [Eremococcus coleocola]|uniref:DNA-processing protein DprA n=1 Tax=Eremococcus coleocola TaxID=88132 RepID=UPI0003F6EBB9|nr:DNA-processing protein DprA [Eremococcus coleocola]
MFINSKFQILCLRKAGWTYHQELAYFKQLIKLNLLEKELSLLEAQEIYASLNFRHQPLNPFIRTKFNYEHLNQLSQQSLFILDEDFPHAWQQLAQPPLLVFFRGYRDLLKQRLISIVGTRSVTNYGKCVLPLLINKILNKNWKIVSGMAQGVDQICHAHAMVYGPMSTIAIIATGFKQVYPKNHEEFQAQLGQKHLLLSEYLPDQKAKRHHFIMRNRLVAGISPVTLVVEAALKSGSLITANYAIQANRELLVLPGRMTDQQSAGCNELIKIGAIPIINLQDLSQELDRISSYFYPKFPLV